jgi:hypothetical protein
MLNLEILIIRIDESDKEDIEYDPNNDKRYIDDSIDWLPPLSNKPRDEFELDSIDDDEERTANNNPTTSDGSSDELRSSAQAEIYMLREKLKKTQKNKFSIKFKYFSSFFIFYN